MIAQPVEGVPSAWTPATAMLTAAAAWRSSSALTVESKLNRTAVWATSGSTPMASSTGEGASEPAAHADPLEQMTPWRSSSSSTDSPLVPGKQKEATEGSRSVGWPVSSAPGTPASTAPINMSRRAETRPASSGRLPGQRQRCRQRHGPGDVFRARTAAAFLSAAVDQRFDPDPSAHKQRAAALGRAQLVAGNAQRVHAQRSGVQRQPAGGLDGVGVEGNALGAGQRHEPGDGLDRADLVVGVHDADQGRPGLEHGSKGRFRHLAEAVHRDHINGEAVDPFEVPGRFFHRGMFDGTDRHPVQARIGGAPGKGDALDGEVVRFRAAGGEDHFPRAAAQGLGGCGAGPGERRGGRLTQGVMA